MAITLGKLTILVGAGLIGSVLAKEGRVSDIVSGAFKIAFKQIKRDDTSRSSSSVKNPNNDSLMAQVNSLRQELQILASSSRSLTIVTASQTGTGKYGIIVITVVLGYGYVWWKGWKLPGLMFATRRSLSDACTAISKQLENVYSSIAATKRKLSSQIDGIDRGLDECLETTTRTQEEVSELRGKTDFIGLDVRSVHDAVQSLETKILRIEGKQDITTEGVRRLCDFASNLEPENTTQRFQAISSSSSRPAIELPPCSPSRSGSLPPFLLSEPESPSFSSGSHQEASGFSEVIGLLSEPGVANRVGPSEGSSNVTPSSRLFGLRIPFISAQTMVRTQSATNGTRSTAGQRL